MTGRIGIKIAAVLAAVAFAVGGAFAQQDAVQLNPAQRQPGPPAEIGGAGRMAHAGQAGRATLSDISSIEPFLDGYMAAAMADQYPPGAMVAVATRDAVFVKAYGSANYETGARATPETLFRIASISKTFVWISVMMLVDEGKLDLDADVNTYLKTVKVKPRFGKPVTMNDLMAHRAGFEDTMGDFFQQDAGGDFNVALADSAPARVAPPGERTSYSNWGTNLAAEVVSDISGEPFDRFVTTRILEPLGMSSTVQHDPAAVASKPLNDPALDARIAAPHRIKDAGTVVMRHDQIDPLHAAGAIALDAHDAARWMQFLLKDGVADGVRLLSPQAFTQMRLRAFPDRQGAPDMAHGFIETEIAGQRTFGHAGTLSGFISDMTIMPSLGVGVFVVVNGAERPRFPDQVSRAVLEQFAASPDQWPSPWGVKATEAMKEKAKSVEGVYSGARHVETRFEKFASLGSEVVVKATDDGALLLSSGGVTHRYYPLAEDLWTDRERDRVFAYRNEDGSVRRISYAMGTSTAEPISFLKSSNGFSAAIGLVTLASLLVFVGAWRRQGREVATTNAGRYLAIGQAGVALLWYAFIGVVVWVSVAMGQKDLADFQEAGWPGPSLNALRIVSHLAALAAIVAAVGLWPVITRSGWSIWRKAHYALFAAAGLFATYELFEWRLILSRASG